MLNAYCQQVLILELAKSDYNGLTADQGWDWLMTPTVSNTQVDTHVRLTPLLAASVLGPMKAEALAKKIQSVLPTIASALMVAGVDLSEPATAAFLDAMVDGTVLQSDVNTLKALGSRTDSTTSPPRFNDRFNTKMWPHITAEGAIGVENDPAIHGFPNTLERADFDVAWQAAGRN